MRLIGGLLRVAGVGAMASALAACPPPEYGLSWSVTLENGLDRACLTSAVEAVAGVSIVDTRTNSYAHRKWNGERIEHRAYSVYYSDGGPIEPRIVISDTDGEQSRLWHSSVTIERAAISQADQDQVLPAMREIIRSIERLCAVDLTTNLQIRCNAVRCDGPDAAVS